MKLQQYVEEPFRTLVEGIRGSECAGGGPGKVERLNNMLVSSLQIGENLLRIAFTM
jgi:hypothetical protein